MIFIPILGILGVVLLGYIPLTRLTNSLHFGERLALGNLLGWGIFTFVLFLINITGVSLTGSNMGLTLALLLSLSVMIKRSKPAKNLKKKHNWTKLEKILFVILGVILGIVLVNGVWGVVNTWDALTLYDFRSLRILETGSIAQSALIQGDYFYSYPLFTSLSHVWLYSLGLSSPMIFYAGIYLSLVTVFFFRLRKSVSRTLALVGALMLAIAPHYFWHAQIPYTNLPYSAFLGLGAVYILSGMPIVGALLTGLSAWTRSVEPFWIANLLILVGMGIWRKDYLRTIFSLIVITPFERAWKIYVAHIHNVATANPVAQVVSTTKSIALDVASSSSSPDKISIFADSLQFFIANAVRPYLPILILFSLSIALKIYRKSNNWWGELLVLMYFGIAYAGTYIFASSQPYWNEIPGSLERMMMFISIPTMYSFILNIKTIFYL